jgi:hypothetical protein
MNREDTINKILGLVKSVYSNGGAQLPEAKLLLNRISDEQVYSIFESLKITNRYISKLKISGISIELEIFVKADRMYLNTSLTEVYISDNQAFTLDLGKINNGKVKLSILGDNNDDNVYPKQLTLDIGNLDFMSQTPDDLKLLLIDLTTGLRQEIYGQGWSARRIQFTPESLNNLTSVFHKLLISKKRLSDDDYLYWIHIMALLSDLAKYKYYNKQVSNIWELNTATERLSSELWERISIYEIRETALNEREYKTLYSIIESLDKMLLQDIDYTKHDVVLTDTEENYINTLTEKIEKAEYMLRTENIKSYREQE